MMILLVVFKLYSIYLKVKTALFSRWIVVYCSILQYIVIYNNIL